ncbi:amino acid permease [Boletus coccyginus]|nr:amino acid permease [Boletus coccyginus]
MASGQGSRERNPVEEPEVHTALQRRLKNRHVAMISFGGIIGTGLFFGTASSLMNGGPLGLLLAYVFMGTICYATMVSLGEMIAFLPLPGGFIKLAERFVDPAFAFATGWNYWYQWTVTLPAELSASAAIISYWNPAIAGESAIWITVGLVLAIGINSLGVGAYGEAEFWFSSIKVLTIVGAIITGIVVDLGGNPKHDLIGFRYWKDPGPFTDYYGFTGAKGQFLGTCSVLTQSMFAFVGTEAVAVAAAEARNPRRNIPKAIKRVYLRILILYIGGVFIIGLLVASDDPSLTTYASVSPFVIAFTNTGIKVLPSIINGAILTSAWSAGSSDLYLGSRSLYGLAVSGSAPRIFSRTTRRGLSHVAVVTCSCFAFLAYLYDLARLWRSLLLVLWLLLHFWPGHVVWYRSDILEVLPGYESTEVRQNYAPVRLEITAIRGMVFSGWTVFLKHNWSVSKFLTDYIPIMLFPILYVTAKFIMRVPTVSANKMDFDTNVAEFVAMTTEEPLPSSRLEAFWRWLVAQDLALASQTD